MSMSMKVLEDALLKVMDAVSAGNGTNDTQRKMVAEAKAILDKAKDKD